MVGGYQETDGESSSNVEQKDTDVDALYRLREVPARILRLSCCDLN